MTDTVRAPAAGTAQGPRMVVQQDSSNSPEHKATNGNAPASAATRLASDLQTFLESLPVME